jgi:hypothetical protein
METNQSPLQKYRRQPKLYIDLPSKGQWYKKGALEKTEELEVYSMTANDEILTKTPDALLNGNATVSIIQNCIPSIKDAWSVTNRDLDYILTAIRIASYGDSLTISHKCSKCENEDSFALPLQRLLDHLGSVAPIYELKVKDFIFRLRPINYKEVVDNQVTSTQVRRAAYEVTDTIKDAEERTKVLNNLYEQINEQTKNLICSICTEIITPEGDSEQNPVFIKDFILNSEGDFFDAIQKLYTENNKKMIVPETEIECSECNHKDKVKPNLDYSNFFSRVS